MAEQIAASEVQRAPDGTIVFMASQFLVELAKRWSKPVQLRFEQDERGHWNLVLRDLPPDWERQTREEPRDAA